MAGQLGSGDGEAMAGHRAQAIEGHKATAARAGGRWAMAGSSDGRLRRRHDDKHSLLG